MRGSQELHALPEVLTVNELAAYLRLSRTAVYEAIRAKVIPSVKIGRRILIPRRAVERLLAESIEGRVFYEGPD